MWFSLLTEIGARLSLRERTDKWCERYTPGAKWILPCPLKFGRGSVNVTSMGNFVVWTPVSFHEASSEVALYSFSSLHGPRTIHKPGQF